MLAGAHTVVGVDFGAPRRARDERRKIIAMAAQAVADPQCRLNAGGINDRLRASEGPGWGANELLTRSAGAVWVSRIACRS